MCCALVNDVKCTLEVPRFIAIVNDDTQPRISFGSTSISEGNSGTKNLAFFADLTNASYQTITVDASTVRYVLLRDSNGAPPRETPPPRTESRDWYERQIGKPRARPSGEPIGPPSSIRGDLSVNRSVRAAGLRRPPIELDQTLERDVLKSNRPMPRTLLSLPLVGRVARLSEAKAGGVGSSSAARPDPTRPRSAIASARPPSPQGPTRGRDKRMRRSRFGQKPSSFRALTP